MSFYSSRGGSGEGARKSGNLGLALAVVKENYSEEFPGMVRVDVPMRSEGMGLTEWVQVVSPYAGPDRGQYFMPEVGDTVVVGYLGNDIRCPIVLGAVWPMGDTLPAQAAEENNNVKKITTKSGCEIAFTDEEGKENITVKTPGGLSVAMSDEEKSITITDATNTVQMLSEDGAIAITADKKITLSCGGATIELSAQGNKIDIKGDAITAEAGQSATVKGQTLKLEGSQSSLKAQSTLTVESSGATNVKGSMVKIN